MNGDCVWTFCVELTTSGNSGDPLNIEVQNFADGTMGSWNNNSCVGQDPPVDIFIGEVGCNTYGCIDPLACNYDLSAACDDGSCTLAGCTSVIACNYDINAACDDGSCTFGGCTDPLACNFNPIAGCDDGSCSYFSMGDITHNFIPCPDTVCTGLQVTYSVTGNQSSIYDWHITGGGLLTTDQTNDCQIVWGNTPGIYTISVQEITEAGCEGVIKTGEVKVVVPDIVFDTTSYSMCLNSSVELGAQPLGGNWSSEYMNGNTFVGTKSGTYYPEYTTNIYGCDITENIKVEVRRKYEAPSIIYSAEIINFCTDSYEQTYFADDSIGITYGWFVDNIKQSSFTEQLIMTWYDTTQTYIIKVIAYDEIGCESKPKLISVRTETCQRFFAPNSFTPNGDGTNDIFKISGLSVYEPTLKIFNRWGDIVYTSSNLWWTGDSGTSYYCDNGVYNWVIEYRDKDGFNKQNSGYVTLIR
jgi:gliding motility-associated-like protein